MKIPFTKMHGIGNDYIYINCFAVDLPDPAAAAIAMSPRHFSVGADGVVLICPSQVADAKMRMFNADGSEGKMCGNAIRCVGKYLYERGLTKKTQLTIETLSGLKYLTLHLEEDTVASVSVDMGAADFAPENIPVKAQAPMVQAPLTVGGKTYTVTCVSMGNPHCVVFTDEDVASLALETIGPKFETHECFPDRINTEFIRPINATTLSMRVWERGSGETWACGTGACAAVAAAVKTGRCPAETEITVALRGGDLRIVCHSDWRITMTGPAAVAYEGVFTL